MQNKFDEVENLAEELGCSYETAWDLVYSSEEIYAETEPDYGL